MAITMSKLSNGLTIVTDPMPHLESASVGVWVNAGARNETTQEHGISHMLEHMAFKGTKTRTARQIAEEIERVGGYLNAYTAREQTAYYARILKGDMPLAINLLADILQNSTFEGEELERERGVIIQEIGQAEDTPDDIIFDHLQAAAFPAQAMGRPILGTIDSVSSFDAESLRRYMRAHYHAPAMTLVASGAVDHDDIVRLASEAFAGLTSQGPVAPEAGTYAGGEFRAEDDLEQAHLSVAWPGVALGHDDALISQVYATALGGGMSSRLFQEVREKRGLCYSIYCFGQSYKDCGLFGVYAGTSAGQASELLKVVAGEMAAMEGSVTSDEVERAKAQLRAGMLMALESPSARCEQIIGHLWSYGRLLTQAEILDKLAGIDAGAVRAFAGRAAQTGPMSLAAMGPLKKLDSFEHIAARFT